jgi:hypothetical protein
MLLSCTDDDNAVAWLKEVDENAPYVAEVDDYETEKLEVVRKQGYAFPYTKGFWYICMLCAAICPDDLDKLDESTPLSNEALSSLLGRRVTEQEYRLVYLQNHSSSRCSCSIM